MTFEKMTFYTVISGLMTLSRQEIKEKLVNNSEVLTVIRENPRLECFLEAYYKCQYNNFFKAFGKDFTPKNTEIWWTIFVNFQAC